MRMHKHHRAAPADRTAHGAQPSGIVAGRDIWGALVIASAVAAGAAQAQTATDVQRAADAERQAREREQQRQLRLQPAPDVFLGPEAPASHTRRLPLDEQPCFRIDGVRFRGAEDTAIDMALLRGAVDGIDGDDAPVGRCLGAQGVGQLIERAQDALIAQGFVTSRVLAPPQDLRMGELVLQVLPGRIQRIRLGRADDRATLRNALPIHEGDVLQLRDVEQGLENLKRVPTVEADIRIEPGQEPGTSDLVVAWEQHKRWRLSLSADDSGSRTSGKFQGSAAFSIDHALALNDLFYVAGSRDLGGGDAGHRGTRGLSTHYSVPFGYWLLSFNASRNRYFQTVAGATQDYLYSGSSQQQDARLTHLFARDAHSKTSWSVKLFARQSANFIDDTEVEVQRRRVGGYELGLQHKAQWGALQVDGNVAFKRGTRAFGANAAPEEAFGEGTHRFKLLAADLQWAMPLGQPSQGWQYAGQWRWQKHHTALTPQDRFNIGGRYTVRGFDGERSLAGDSGWLARNELSTALSDTGQRVYAALDHGRVSGPSAHDLPGRQLTGFAFGLRGTLGFLHYDVFVGGPVHKPKGFRTAGATFGVGVSAQF
jgi:hemolysin activation/secretion protein